MLLDDKRNISINSDESINFIKNSERVSLPVKDADRKRVISQTFENSCMLVKLVGRGYEIGVLNSTGTFGYSMIIRGEEQFFSYAETEMAFKPRLC